MTNLPHLHTDRRPTATEAIALYLAVGWGTPADYDPAAWQQAISRNDFIVTLYQNDQLIGLARTLSDGHNATYVSDIVVHPAHQKQGLGTRMMAAIQTHYAHTPIYVCGLTSASEFLIKCGIKKREQIAAFSKAPAQAA